MYYERVTYLDKSDDRYSGWYSMHTTGKWRGNELVRTKMVFVSNFLLYTFQYPVPGLHILDRGGNDNGRTNG